MCGVVDEREVGRAVELQREDLWRRGTHWTSPSSSGSGVTSSAMRQRLILQNSRPDARDEVAPHIDRERSIGAGNAGEHSSMSAATGADPEPVHANAGPWLAEQRVQVLEPPTCLGGRSALSLATLCGRRRAGLARRRIDSESDSARVANHGTRSSSTAYQVSSMHDARTRSSCDERRAVLGGGRKAA